MRLLVGVVALAALAGCAADGKPSSLVGSALSGFARGFGDGTAGAEQPAPAKQRPLLTSPGAQSSPPTVQAVFTGQARQVSTVTSSVAWECQYDYAGQKFLVVLDNYCTPSIQVR